MSEEEGKPGRGLLAGAVGLLLVALIALVQAVTLEASSRAGFSVATWSAAAAGFCALLATKVETVRQVAIGLLATSLVFLVAVFALWSAP